MSCFRIVFWIIFGKLVEITNNFFGGELSLSAILQGFL